MVLKLHTYPGSARAFKALVAAEYNGVKIDVPSTFVMGKTNKTPEFLKLNPHGKVPCLETPEGGIFESNAIARYVARLADNGLYGTNALEAAQIEQWIDFSTGEIDAPLCSWVYPYKGFWAYDEGKEKAAKDAIAKAFGVLDSVLASRTYLVGNTITLADIIACCNMLWGFQNVLDPAFMKPFPNVVRYFTTLINQPNFVKVMGKVESVKKPPTPPKGAAAPAAGGGKKADKKEKKAAAATGKYTLKVEVATCNIKKIDTKVYGITKPSCQATVKVNGQEFKTESVYGLDPVWEVSHEFKINDPATDKVAAVLHCQDIKIGDECTFLLDKLVKGKATYKGLIVPGGKVDMLFTAVDFGPEEAPQIDDGFMDFL